MVLKFLIMPVLSSTFAVHPSVCHNDILKIVFIEKIGQIPLHCTFDPLVPATINSEVRPSCSAGTSSLPSNIYAKFQVYAHSAAVSQMTLRPPGGI